MLHTTSIPPQLLRILAQKYSPLITQQRGLLIDQRDSLYLSYFPRQTNTQLVRTEHFVKPPSCASSFHSETSGSERRAEGNVR